MFALSLVQWFVCIVAWMQEQEAPVFREVLDSKKLADAMTSAAKQDEPEQAPPPPAKQQPPDPPPTKSQPPAHPKAPSTQPAPDGEPPLPSLREELARIVKLAVGRKSTTR